MPSMDEQNLQLSLASQGTTLVPKQPTHLPQIVFGGVLGPLDCGRLHLGVALPQHTTRDEKYSEIPDFVS